MIARGAESTRYAECGEDANDSVPFQTFEVRTVGDPDALVPTVREVVRQIDPRLPLLNVTTRRATIAGNWKLEEMLASIASLFGGLALAVSASGLFGLMSYLVACRTREIGSLSNPGHPRVGFRQAT